MSRHQIEPGMAFTDNIQTDPGAADDYLDVTVYGSVQHFTAAATRKLANSETAGNELVITSSTGDNVVITADQTFDGTNNTLTLTVANEWIILKAVLADATNGGYQWRIVENGVAGGGLTSV